MGKGCPRRALSFFDVFSEMEFEEIRGINFLSVQDLFHFYEDQKGHGKYGMGEYGYNPTGYELVLFFMKKNPDALYFVDEVPLIINSKLNHITTNIFSDHLHNHIKMKYILSVF